MTSVIGVMRSFTSLATSSGSSRTRASPWSPARTPIAVTSSERVHASSPTAIANGDTPSSCAPGTARDACAPDQLRQLVARRTSTTSTSRTSSFVRVRTSSELTVSPGFAVAQVLSSPSTGTRPYTNSGLAATVGKRREGELHVVLVADRPVHEPGRHQVEALRDRRG